MRSNCPPPQAQEAKSGSERFYRKTRLYLFSVVTGVLRLRRVQVSLTLIIVSMLILAFPGLAALREELLLLIAASLMVALGGYSLEEALQEGSEGMSDIEADLEEMLDDPLFEPDSVKELDDAQT